MTDAPVVVTHPVQPYMLSTEHARLDVEAIHAFLARSYWAKGIPLATVRRSVEHSLCFGLYDAGNTQAGFARVVTDRATFAYLADVYVLEAHRGRGLGRWLVSSVLAHPALQGLRRIMLVTRDADMLYAPFGFRAPTEPSGIMHIHHASE
ncbi:MAG: GNAT family N-acetyltransferase [bacterium]